MYFFVTLIAVIFISFLLSWTYKNEKKNNILCSLPQEEVRQSYAVSWKNESVPLDDYRNRTEAMLSGSI